jgi:hypothetical protein
VCCAEQQERPEGDEGAGESSSHRIGIRGRMLKPGLRCEKPNQAESFWDSDPGCGNVPVLD